MNHVDIDLENRGNSVTLFTNHPEDYGHIKALSEEYKKDNPEMAKKYVINLGLYQGAKVSLVACRAIQTTAHSSTTLMEEM